MSPPAIKSTGDPVWSPLHARSDLDKYYPLDFDAFALPLIVSGDAFRAILFSNQTFADFKAWQIFLFRIPGATRRLPNN